MTISGADMGDGVHLNPIARALADRGWLQWMSDPAIGVSLAGSLPMSRLRGERVLRECAFKQRRSVDAGMLAMLRRAFDGLHRQP